MDREQRIVNMLQELKVLNEQMQQDISELQIMIQNSLPQPFVPYSFWKKIK
jgi:hypothetical protein